MKRIVMASALLFVTLLTVGCQSKMGGSCAGGQCGLLGGGACAGGACEVGSGSAAQHGGPLGAIVSQHHAGPQSHMGASPGPAEGQASPTYGYPYYTTRGPRDFLNPNPPSIGR